MDVGTGITLLGPSAVALKLLGPTADYVGVGVKTWTEHRVENVQRIFGASERKVDAATIDEPGAVPPRVLRGVLAEGSFVVDDVGAEYFAGVLAGSRSPDGKDDRGVATIAVLDALSTWQLRAHYVMYRAAQAVAAAHPEVNWYTGAERSRIRKLAVRTEDLVTALQHPSLTGGNVMGLLGHVVVGLRRSDLLAHGWAMGTPESLRSSSRYVEWPGHCIMFDTTDFGIEIYCAAHGFTVSPLDDFKRPTSDFEARWGAAIPPCQAIIVDDLPPYVPPTED